MAREVLSFQAKVVFGITQMVPGFLRILIVIATATVTIGVVLFRFMRPGTYGGDGLIFFMVACLLSLGGFVRILTISTAELNALFHNDPFCRGFCLWFCIACGMLPLC